MNAVQEREVNLLAVQAKKFRAKLPLKRRHFSVELPLRRGSCLLPVKWLSQWLRTGGAGQRGAHGLFLFRANQSLRPANKKRRAAPREQVEPLTVLVPRHGVGLGQPAAVGIHQIESAVLGGAKGQTIHTHFPGASPIFAAGVIANAIQFKNPG